MDFENNQGWMHKSLLQGDRYGIINTSHDQPAQIYNKPKGNVIGTIGKKNIVKIEKCLKDWCNIKYNQYKGWIIKLNLWGIYEEEIFNVPFYQPIVNQFWKIN